jgi:hypothetical protein
MRSFTVKSKEDEMGGAYNTKGGDEKSERNFDWEA